MMIPRPHPHDLGGDAFADWVDVLDATPAGQPLRAGLTRARRG